MRENSSEREIERHKDRESKLERVPPEIEREIYQDREIETESSSEREISISLFARRLREKDRERE